MATASTEKMRNSLKDPQVAATLDRLHEAARGDRWKFAAIMPQVLFGVMRGKKFFEAMSPELMADVYIPVSREQGKFLYLMARTIGAKRVVEFGTSFGISTIYLAAAVRDNRGDNGGEIVIGTELEPGKHEKALANIAEAGLADFVDVRLGDAIETLQDVPEPVDMVLIDGWKDLYLPIVKMLTPKLRPGSVVLGDNIYTFRKSLRPYVEYMQSGENGFESETLSLADGFEYSVYVG